MITTKHIPVEDLALFAMQFLSPQERAPIILHLEHCSECSRELATVQGDLAAYAFTAEMHSPPALARQRLLKQVGREKKFVAPPVRHHEVTTQYSDAERPFMSTYNMDEDDEPQRKSVATLALPWLGWAVAAGVTFFASNLYKDREALQNSVVAQTAQMGRLSADAAKARMLMEALTSPDAMRVTLRVDPTLPPQPFGRTTYMPDKGMLVFVASNMNQLPAYKTYELWLIPADGHDPIPAGTFKPDTRGNASVVMPEIPKGIIAQAFGITIEDDGGSQTPTKPIIMSGM